MPFFSVVIPLYNKEPFIGQTLQSLIAQTFADFEIIIINDGSTDAGEAKVLSFPDPRIRYYLRENKGVSAARNLGITMAKGQYIAFLDADDHWYPDFLQCMHRNITRFPDQKVFSCAIEIETAKNLVPAEYSIDRNHPVEIVDFFKASFKETVLWTSATVIHKSVFDRSGMFDTRMRSGEDTDLWIRIGLDYPVVFDWKVMARYGFDPKSLSRDRSYTTSKIDFSKFDALEPTHPDLKKYLDMNRFALAVKSKLNGDKKAFRHLEQGIDPGNLSPKRRILLQLPGGLLRALLQINRWLAENGLGNSVFR